MKLLPIDHTHTVGSQHQLTYPLHKIVAAMPRSEAGEVTVALHQAGFTRDRIDVILAEDVPELNEPIGGSGFHRVWTRLLLSLGDDLDELERVRRELVRGHALIQVRVHGSEELNHVRSILDQYGDHDMVHFGRWTITPVDDR